ncbi:hypothetical protein GGS23DRAFT_550438 [Durotheca rogersii]|uniref:uncharacterized protein n=1 Tax=Durotheca rogersii TaxID=419775 RepID=UPI00221E3AA4|nr:uncharacterized protein GGS23DRAFT_550438 [Durotheca rogersii]KAI5867867.1 hypothetical protein GGS23DRAFT_550438 [Durotheca rogersii]
MAISKYAAAAAHSFGRLSTSRISQFFEQHGPATSEDCDRLAADILSCPLLCPPHRCNTSYTCCRISLSLNHCMMFHFSKLLSSVN